MSSECHLNANQMATECASNPYETIANDIRMLAFVLADCDELHQGGHMDTGTYGAIVSLAVYRLEQIESECRLNGF